MKATEQYFPVVLFVMLYKEVLSFESVGVILMCNHSNESWLSTFLSRWFCGCNLIFRGAAIDRIESRGYEFFLVNTA